MVQSKKNKSEELCLWRECKQDIVLFNVLRKTKLLLLFHRKYIYHRQESKWNIAVVGMRGCS